jgi:hypothetical protein
VTAPAISTRSGRRYLKSSPPQWLRRSNCGINALDIPAPQHSPRSCPPLNLAAISQKITLVNPVTWASMFAFHFILLRHQPFSLFKLFTRMFGHPQFLAIQVSNTMLCSWMISLIIFGPSRFVLSLTFSQLFDPFMLTCKLSSVYQLLRSKLTTAANSTLLPLAPSSPTTASPSASLARIRPSRTARRNACCARLTIVCEPC